MEHKRAVKLLDDTFNNGFDLERFSSFIKELFNHFQLRTEPKILQRRVEYKDFVEKIQHLGNYKDDNNDTIEVFTVQLKKSSSRDRARTMQRNLVSKYLESYGSKAALVAFYGDEQNDWRFSFVKMEYDLLKDEKGYLKAKIDLTPAKRFSFLVGENEPNHTCKYQFLELIEKEDSDPYLNEIEKAFSIEKVTKDFYTKYECLYKDLKESLEKSIENDEIILQDFENKVIKTSDFAKKLMGQIIFIYFLQKKGWLGVKKGEKWGTGPKNFLRKLYDGKIVPYDNFFNDLLEPLFYEGLAKKCEDDFFETLMCRIPFLNGGLFEPINNYDWKNTNIKLKNEIFQLIIKTFDRYNFTVKEDEPLEKEVAVDPEMLGKVFENLLDVEDRKTLGSFYTPREVVHYMCQESLINYLKTNSEIPHDDIEYFIHFGDFTLDSLIREIVRSGKIIKEREIGLPKSIRKNHHIVDDLLRDIKVVDPAVGSGAFPVGMMNEIVKLRSILSLFSGKKTTNYQLKLETIENSLYGVDIDSSAVDIAKLRFWLSLIVDENDATNIDPLPNLDHKIMCGNSLLEEFEGNKLFDEDLLLKIPQDYSKKIKDIQKEIDNLHMELGQIFTGKRQDDDRKTQIIIEIKKLENQKKKLQSTSEDETNQFTLDENFNKRINKSHKSLKELKRLLKLFFKEQDSKLKNELRDKIDTIEWNFIEDTLKDKRNEKALLKLEEFKINKSKPFFLWKLYFSEVFHRENPGFDIVIANPPYKSNKGNDSNLKKSYKDYFGISDDLYNYFYLKSFEVVREKGVVTFISSNTYFTINSKKNLRKLFQNSLIKEIFSVGNVFEVPMVDTAINMTQKENTDGINYFFKFKDGKNSFKKPITYEIDIETYRHALNNVFFHPSPLNLGIYDKYNKVLIDLEKEWWSSISTSKNITKNFESLENYRSTLKPSDITLLGLITDGGQGLATADNGRFLGVREDSKNALSIKKSRPKKFFTAIKNNKIGNLNFNSIEEVESYLNNKTEEEICDLFDCLKSQYGRDIFGKGYLYKIISTNLIADVDSLTKDEKSNGIKDNKPYYVPYDKGDRDGNRWYLATPFVIDWSEDSVQWLKSNSGKKGIGMPVVRNSKFYFKEGFCWILTLNEFSEYQKARIKEPGVFDVNAMTLIPVMEKINSKYLVSLLNSYLIYHIKFNFINNTSAFQINDARQLPIIIPSSKQLTKFEDIFDRALETKKKEFNHEIEPKIAKDILEGIQNELDLLVYELYNISIQSS